MVKLCLDIEVAHALVIEGDMAVKIFVCVLHAHYLNTMEALKKLSGYTTGYSYKNAVCDHP